jgi:hypothetical protein
LDQLQALLEIKAVDPKGRTIEGYASAFGNIDRQDDVVASTFFDDFLATHKPGDVTVLIAHNMQSLPVGMPIELRTDGTGLFTKTKVFKTTAGDDLLATARELHANGRRLGMSIGYRPTDFAFEEQDGRTIRILKSGDLIEYSYAPEQIVSNPRATTTGVKAKHDDGIQPGPHSDLQAVNAELVLLPLSGLAGEAKTAIETHLERHRAEAGLNVDVDLDLIRAGMSLVATADQLTKELHAQHVLGDEYKAGRRISKATRRSIQNVLDGLAALLKEDDEGKTTINGKAMADIDAALAASKEA